MNGLWVVQTLKLSDSISVDDEVIVWIARRLPPKAVVVADRATVTVPEEEVVLAVVLEGVREDLRRRGSGAASASLSLEQQVGLGCRRCVRRVGDGQASPRGDDITGLHVNSSEALVLVPVVAGLGSACDRTKGRAKLTRGKSQT